MIHNDAVIFGLLCLILAGVFVSSSSQHPIFSRFFKIVPALLMCYFLPSLLVSSGLVDVSESKLYFVASRYLLPASLVLLTISIDLNAIKKLGNKAIIMFLTGTVGIVVGGPVALLVVSWFAPETLGIEGPSAVWRGMTTVAGSWIGGGANQTAMKEIFGVGDDIFSAMVAVDILMANVWMAVLLYLAANHKVIDEKRAVDNSAIRQIEIKMSELQTQYAVIPSLQQLMIILAVGFTATGLAHFCADLLSPFFAENFPRTARFSLTSHFFWLIVVATSLGIVLSRTSLRTLEGAGASKIGSVFIYILVATIGLKMDIAALAETPIYFVIGFIWMAIHAGLMLFVAWRIKSPLFFMAVGSQANVGGAASAPVVAAAFNPALAPVGVLLAVLGYALGTYAAWLCGQILRVVSGG